MIQLIENPHTVEVLFDIPREQRDAIWAKNQHRHMETCGDLVMFGKPDPWGGFIDCFSLTPDLKIHMELDRPMDKLDGTCYLPLDDLDFQLSVLAKLREVMK